MKNYDSLVEALERGYRSGDPECFAEALPLARQLIKENEKLNRSLDQAYAELSGAHEQWELAEDENERLDHELTTLRSSIEDVGLFSAVERETLQSRLSAAEKLAETCGKKLDEYIDSVVLLESENRRLQELVDHDIDLEQQDLQSRLSAAEARDEGWKAYAVRAEAVVEAAEVHVEDSVDAYKDYALRDAVRRYKDA